MFVPDQCGQNTKLSLTPLEYVKGQSTIGTKEISGSGREAISHYFHLPYLPCKEVHMLPQLPLHEINGVNNEKFNRLLLPSFSMPSYVVQLTK